MLYEEGNQAQKQLGLIDIFDPLKAQNLWVIERAGTLMTAAVRRPVETRTRLNVVVDEGRGESTEQTDHECAQAKSHRS